jgi:polyhydroxybutyrate depolymerase
MKRVLRALRFALLTALAIVGLGSVLFLYYLHTPAPEIPQLSGTLTKASVEVGGLKRTYTTYVPHRLSKRAALVFALHGSGENSAEMRIATGYRFDRLADEHGFGVVYPNGYEGYWNGCNIVGDYSANKLNIDDVAFLSALAGKLTTELGVDRGRVFATGVSRGASMALRLALEAPSHFRAVAAVSDNMPTPDNFKCKAATHGTSSVMIMNGTEDPLVPFDGGDVNLFGLFVKRGKVLGSRQSAQYFADMNHLASAPETKESQLADGVRVEQLLWRDDSKVEVELVAIHGGGHGIPQPYRRRPRLLGPSPKEPNGPDMIWAFFDRQPAL